jgi:hypothetical protein
MAIFLLPESQAESTAFILTFCKFSHLQQRLVAMASGGMSYVVKSLVILMYFEGSAAQPPSCPNI